MIRGEISLLISTDSDVVSAKQKAKIFAEKVGLNGNWPAALSTIIAELASRILKYTVWGKIYIKTIQRGVRPGIEISVFNNNNKSIKPPEIKNDFLTDDNTELALMISRNIADELNVTQFNDSNINTSLIKWLE